ncbi:hypothetical protein PTKIN_Ptkin17bG0051600 [Pterospermum kingtungense]
MFVYSWMGIVANICLSLGFIEDVSFPLHYLMRNAPLSLFCAFRKSSFGYGNPAQQTGKEMDSYTDARDLILPICLSSTALSQIVHRGNLPYVHVYHLPMSFKNWKLSRRNSLMCN